MFLTKAIFFSGYADKVCLITTGNQCIVAPTWDRGDLWISSLRYLAKEGDMFVISCCMPLHINDIPEKFEFKNSYPEGTEWINDGMSCIIGPDGDILAEPAVREETILYAELDLQKIINAKRMFDVAGHYARPDIFKLMMDQSPSPTLIGTKDSSI